jgi:maltose alpha-D-glucosyltransferase / alpha-amylase
MENLKLLWTKIYGENHYDLLQDFINQMNHQKMNSSVSSLESEWYKDVTVYSLYVDLFNVDFQGLETKLNYLSGLGVSCLWLLPILESPMRDAGFDISDYQKVRADLLGKKAQSEVFDSFMKKAHDLGIKVIFDIAINHTSEDHFWFQESKKSKDNPYRDYYIWNTDDQKYKDARLIFYGIENSNWKKLGDEFFFHRFFDFQPDLNYRNPKVLIEMCQNFLFWLDKGVDGFRADAIPYLWKEEGTDCENLPMTHVVVKFFRSVIDFVRPNTLLLAEACQKPAEVVKYFGNGDECHAGYHFPLMPQIFKAIASQSNAPIIETLSPKITPIIPQSSQWFTFLRCHDELSLELVYVSEADRAYIHSNFCLKPEWDFRLGQGISARLAELMNNDFQKIGLIYSIMLTLPGTPVIYYGDEFGKNNDENYYDEQIKLTGKDDTRFLVRGRIDWQKLENNLTDLDSLESKVFTQVSKMLKKRTRTKVFGRGDIYWHQPACPTGEPCNHVLMFERSFNGERYLLIHNLANHNVEVSLGEYLNDLTYCVINPIKIEDDYGNVVLAPYSYHWLMINS